VANAAVAVSSAQVEALPELPDDRLSMMVSKNCLTSNRDALSSSLPTRAHQCLGERNNQLSSGCSKIGTASSNSLRSANESQVRGILRGSAQTARV
jgi:hypothetical protein